MSKKVKINEKKERELTKRAILKYYFKGHIKSDPQLYDNILHDNWKFFVFSDNKLNIVEKNEYKSWYSPKKFDPFLKWSSKFYYIDITGKMAQVKFKLENQNVKYTDYFNLIKEKENWWIVNKLCHWENKD